MYRGAVYGRGHVRCTTSCQQCCRKIFRLKPEATEGSREERSPRGIISSRVRDGLDSRAHALAQACAGLDRRSQARRLSTILSAMPETAKDDFLYSPAVSQAVAASFGVGSNLTWDAFVRQSYEKVNAVIQQQANDLLRRGNVLEAEARALVEGQRNALVRAMRERLSPFGRLYSEISKPSPSLPTLERLVREKGSIQAVLTSVGKSRAVVNRFAAVARVAGPGTIVIQFTVSAVVITSASPEDRARVVAREAGGIGGAALGGWGGAWAGCAGLATVASPSLVLPIVGKVTTGGACLVGGIAGGFGAGWLGYVLGQWAGEASHDFATEWLWVRQ